MSRTKSPNSLQQQHPEFKVCHFNVPGAELLPSSIPLAIPDNAKYDRGKNQIKVLQGAERSKLNVCKTALELFNSIKKPVAVLSICGPYRTGKSYILSKLLGSPDAFKLGHTFNAQTVGIWVATTYLDFGDYAMVLLDTEGINAPVMKSSEDIRIVVLSVLLSSFFVYNSMRVPDKTDLERMSCFTQLATNIRITQNMNGRSCGGEDDIRERFPDFLWLLRDVTLQPTDKEGRQISPLKYINTQVFDECDEVAVAVNEYFRSLDCRKLPPPSADSDVLQNIEMYENELSPKFLAEVDKLLCYLRSNSKPKKGFGTSAGGMDGPTLALLTEKYLEAINDPNAVPCLDSTWKLVSEARCKVITSQLVKEYKEEMDQEVANKFPMEQEEEDVVSGGAGDEKKLSLMGIHKRILQAKLAVLEQATRFLSPTTDTCTRDDWRKEVLDVLAGKIFTAEEDAITGEKVVTGGILHSYIKQNYDKSVELCTREFDYLYQQIRQRIDKELSIHGDDSAAISKKSQDKTSSSSSSSSSSYTLEDYHRDRSQMQEDYNAKAVGPAKLEVWERKFEETKHDEWLVSKLPHYERKITDLASQLSSTEKEIKGCNRTIKKLRTEKNEVKKEWSDLQSKVAELEREKDQAVAEYTKLRRQAIRDALQGRQKKKTVKVFWGLFKRTRETVSELEDEDAEIIARAWFQQKLDVTIVTNEMVRTECQKLKLNQPRRRDASVIQKSLPHLGRELFHSGLVEIDRPSKLKMTDVVISEETTGDTSATTTASINTPTTTTAPEAE